MSVNSKMTAIADAIRAKTGGTGLLTLDDMAQDIAAIDTSENLDEVLDEQDSIIDQIQAALEGKSAAAPQTATLTVNLPASGYAFACIDADGNQHSEVDAGNYVITVPVPSVAVFGYSDYTITGDYEQIYTGSTYGIRATTCVIRGNVNVVGPSNSGEPT